MMVADKILQILTFCYTKLSNQYFIYTLYWLIKYYCNVYEFIAQLATN